MLSLNLKVLFGSLAAVALTYAASCTLLFVRQTHLIFFPSKTIETTPSALNLPYEEVWIPVTPSSQALPSQETALEQMHGWWLPAQGVERGVVLHLHGNGANIGANLSQALRFHQLGFAVLMVDYRGYGRSGGGFPTEANVYQDAKAAWNYLVQRRGIDPKRLVLFGHSLGGAIAIDLALAHPEAAGLIVQSSFTNTYALIDPAMFRFFPIDLLLTQRFDSISKVRSLRLPVLYIHGTVDTKIPASMSADLYAASPQPKQLFWVAGAAHNNVAEVGESDYLQAVKKFVDLCDRRQQGQPQS